MNLKGKLDDWIPIMILLFGYLGLKLQERNFQKVLIKKMGI